MSAGSSSEEEVVEYEAREYVCVEPKPGQTVSQFIAEMDEKGEFKKRKITIKMSSADAAVLAQGGIFVKVNAVE